MARKFFADFVHLKRITFWLAVFPAIATLALAATAAAQTIVVGAGDPDVDVPAVQAAVDQGGEVILRGHLSFNRPPTIPTALQGYPPAMVLVSKAVTISGAGDERDDDREMTTIEAGTIPFYVEAPGAAVTIRGLRFVRPKEGAVLVYAVSGFVIASCKIEGVEPWPHFGSTGIEIDTSGNPFGPGHPENISGTLLIVNNDIDMVGGTASDAVLGVITWFAGVPGAEVEAYISGNTIRNITERSINIRQIGGRVYVEANAITTGTIVGPTTTFGSNPDAVYVFGSGSYLVAHNSIDHQWTTGNGITASATTHATVVDNNINMEAPDCTVFGENSSGIDVRGNNGNVVLNNRIRGCARAALAVLGGADTAFVLNHFHDFEASLADVFVGDGVMNTRIVGPGTVEDHGTGTIIVPVPNFGRNHEEGGDENRNHTGEEPREK